MTTTTIVTPTDTANDHVAPSYRRFRKGMRMEDAYPSHPPLPPSINNIDSPFQLQEYITLLIRQDPHDVQRMVALPGAVPAGKGKEAEGKEGGAEVPEDGHVDTDVWIYEQLRRLTLDLSTPWLTSLQQECDKNQKPDTCDAMNAGDWMYLCASHGEEKQCCAIDYVIHTIDFTTALLNSPRHFPSRLAIPGTSLRHFGSTARRLSRIFAHTYHHHREVFEACEAETSLYARFLALARTYDLIATDGLPDPLSSVSASEAAATVGLTSPSSPSKSPSRDVTLGKTGSEPMQREQQAGSLTVADEAGAEGGVEEEGQGGEEEDQLNRRRSIKPREQKGKGQEEGAGKEKAKEEPNGEESQAEEGKEKDKAEGASGREAEDVVIDDGDT